MSDYSQWDAHFSPPHLPHLDPQGRRGRENAKNFRTCPGNSKYWLIDLNFLNVNVEKLKIKIWKNFLCLLHGDRSDKVSQIISKNSVSHHLCSICFDRKNKIDGETVMMTVTVSKRKKMNHLFDLKLNIPGLPHSNINHKHFQYTQEYPELVWSKFKIYCNIILNLSICT